MRKFRPFYYCRCKQYKSAFFFSIQHICELYENLFVLAKISHKKLESHKFDKESLSAIAFKSSSEDE